MVDALAQCSRISLLVDAKGYSEARTSELNHTKHDSTLILDQLMLNIDFLALLFSIGYSGV